MTQCLPLCSTGSDSTLESETIHFIEKLTDNGSIDIFSIFEDKLANINFSTFAVFESSAT